MPSIDLWSFILSQLSNVPFYIVFVVGMILSVVFWKRHPSVSILSLMAFSLFLGNMFILSGMQYWLMGAHQTDLSAAEIGRIATMLGIIRTLLGSVAWIMLLSALFGWRSTSASH